MHSGAWTCMLRNALDRVTIMQRDNIVQFQNTNETTTTTTAAKTTPTPNATTSKDSERNAIAKYLPAIMRILKTLK